MRNEDRAKWCIEQAMALAKDLPPRDSDAPKTMDELAVIWLYDTAKKFQEHNYE